MGVEVLKDSVNIYVQAQDIAGLTISGISATGTTFNGSDLTNTWHKGAYFLVAMASMNATATVRVQIQGKDSISGLYYTITSLSIDAVSVTTTGNLAQTICIYPAIATVAAAGGNITQAVGLPLPKTFRVQASLSFQASATANASNMTVSVNKIL